MGCLIYHDYLSSRYSQYASNGKRKGLVCVLRAITDTTTSSTTNTSSTTTRNYLQKGDSGSAVKDLQTKLNSLGFNCGEADGIFGDKTDAAVRAFQTKYSLTVDGQAGTNTMAKINSLITSATSSATATSTKKEWTKKLQKAIKAEVDGVPGSETLSKCPTLKSGSSGDVTKLLQEYLGDFCKIGVTGGYDGKFGAGTKAALIEYQRQNGLTMDGIAGKNTWKKILGI